MSTVQNLNIKTIKSNVKIICQYLNAFIEHIDWFRPVSLLVSAINNFSYFLTSIVINIFVNTPQDVFHLNVSLTPEKRTRIITNVSRHKIRNDGRIFSCLSDI